MTKDTKPKPKPKPVVEQKDNLPKKGWVFPVSSPRPISDDFAEHKARRNPPSYDPGTDYVKPTGSRIRSIYDGRVISVDKIPDGGGGRMVFINHGNGVVSHYLHLDTITVRPGIRVLAGTIIGTVGGSGFGKDNHYGSHLHISIIRDGVHVDPDFFLRGRNAK
jgi:murein DD-endopeptidase MepM/ murein hydrolase activator NlpD